MALDAHRAKRNGRRTEPRGRAADAGVVSPARAGATRQATGGKPRRSALPAAIAPMLATLAKEAPEGDGWLHEFKYDGYRILARIDRGRVRLVTRNGNDWTRSFPTVARDLATLPVETAWLDGEMVVVDAHGRTRFQALQNALAAPHAPGIAFFAFDVLFRDGADLRALPLVERKRQLREIVGARVGAVRPSPDVRGHGGEFFRKACALGLEGAVCKRADAPYASGMRSRDWLKVKCVQRQEMVIGGYTDPQGGRRGFGALLLGYYDGGALRYAGKVGTGFDDATLRTLAPALSKRERATPAFVDPPRGHAAKGAHWIDPDLVAEIAFTEWSRDGALRHPSFQGLRADKKAREVVREKAAGARRGAARRAAAARKKATKVVRAARAAVQPVVVAGIALSNPDKPYFPEAGITKRALAEYYAAVADRLLPHIARRPLSLLRCPDGRSRACFYQKHADPAVSPKVTRVEVPERSGTATYLSAASAAALVGLVQWGVIELHPWGSRAPRLDRPDQLIFDLDPDDGVPWSAVVKAVELLLGLQAEIGLRAFVKTTGGKGLHVVVPIRPTLTWDDAKAFSRGVAEWLAATFPDRFTATASKAKRRDRIFVDYLRNAEGATAIAPYAVRARQNAPVATPIDVAELRTDVRFDHFNLRTLPARLARLRTDPWAAFFDTRQTVTAAMRKRLA